MKIEKLPSGSYRLRKQYKGKSYTVTVPYKPSQREALRLMSEKIEEDAILTPLEAPTSDFRYYSGQFIVYLEEAGKSPSTVRGYMSIRKNLPEWFLDTPLADVTQEALQKVVNEYSVTHSPKSTRNTYGFIRSVLTKYKPQGKYSIILPPKTNKAEYEPTTRDVQRCLEASKGSKYEIVLHLCALGLRRGEAIAITSDDVSTDNVLTINKDIVLDRHNNYVLKDKPKTEESFRRILIPSSLADLIREQGVAYQGNAHSINEYLHRLQDNLGIPRFRLHMLRHFCVAYLHREGFSDQQIMSYGGWSNSSDVMKRAYRYNLDPEESQKEIASSLGNIFS